MKTEMSAYGVTELTPEETFATSGGMFLGIFPVIIGIAAIITAVAGAVVGRGK
ncbi:hypothetical protein [Bradyrhizobium sp. Cp5.3]|uniref:hypothetical protein n=1 Tax=Bradyrhizobium sp. Cp5.3 TaxID=443598 RepID=UPI0012EB1321|nr:hypothetical protein [Bradyrhizobium sp. Cp5.3]